MKKLSIVLLLIFMSGSAFALTPQEVADNYNACLKFLAMSTADQLNVIARTELTYEQGLAVCRNLTSRSLEENQELERRYQEGLRSSPVLSGPVYCYSDMSCVSVLTRADSPSQCPFGTGSYDYFEYPGNCALK